VMNALGDIRQCAVDVEDYDFFIHLNVAGLGGPILFETFFCSSMVYS
jgi:hypothetical protein